MSYVTQAQLIDRFGETELIQLTDRTGTGAIDTGVLASKITDSDALIDSYLQARYALPLATVPTALVRIAADIVRYDLQADRPTENASDRFKAAMGFLMRVADGKLQLGTDASTAPVASATGPEFTAPCRVFDQQSFADYSE